LRNDIGQSLQCKRFEIGEMKTPLAAKFTFALQERSERPVIEQ
jgi:hypothetical protein